MVLLELQTPQELNLGTVAGGLGGKAGEPQGAPTGHGCCIPATQGCNNLPCFLASSSLGLLLSSESQSKVLLSPGQGRNLHTFFPFMVLLPYIEIHEST